MYHCVSVDIHWLGDIEDFIEVPPDFGCKLTVEKRCGMDS